MTPTHWEEIHRVTQHIRRNIDGALDRATLAGMIGYSEVHFHRLFVAHVGETLSAYIRRVRMQQAARRLLSTPDDVIDVALCTGYGTHAAFSKVFKRFFGVSPSDFRKMHGTAAAFLIERRLIFSTQEHKMEPIELMTLPDQQVLYARASELMTAPAFQTANIEASNTLMGFLERRGLFPQVRHMVAIYPDAAEVGTVVRFDFGAILQDGVQPDLEEGIAYQTLTGGRWAKFQHVGPYDTLWHTWMTIYRDWLPNSGETLRQDTLCYEDYVDRPDEVEPEKLRTEIYIPIE